MCLVIVVITVQQSMQLLAVTVNSSICFSVNHTKSHTHAVTHSNSNTCVSAWEIANSSARAIANALCGLGVASDRANERATIDDRAT